MNDPVIQALQYFKVDGWFEAEQLPHAKMLLQQASGRLIRKEDDSGVIVCCDQRLINARYGKYLREGLPEGIPILTGMDDWDEFVGKLEEFCEKEEKNE